MRIKWHTENPPAPTIDRVVGEDYLVTYEGGGMDIARWTNMNVFWGGLVSDWHWICAQYCKVAAWMPLPEEYHS